MVQIKQENNQIRLSKVQLFETIYKLNLQNNYCMMIIYPHRGKK